MVESGKVQNLFLVCFASVYLIAFVSLFVQIPGLYGNNGLLPARLALSKDVKSLEDAVVDQPTLLHVLKWFGVLDVETAFNLICLGGIVLSFLAFIKSSFRSSLVFMVLWLFYQSLFRVGQTFLWFQWDTLLLELGFLTIFVAPLSVPFVDLSELTKQGRVVAFWLVRWLTFRLMFSSGVVKLNSQCPTWWGLTAMTHHYETQCIPTPLSWYSHQMPLWFHRASTAFVFIIQVATTILFFSPYRAHKIFSFILQSALMVMIMMTGNYNFFNWISVVMCLSLVDDKFLTCLSSIKNQKECSKSSKCCKVPSVVKFIVKATKFIVHAAVAGSIIYVARNYFNIGFKFSPFEITSDIEFSYEEFQLFLHWFVPLTLWVAAGSLAATIVCSLLKCVYQEKGLLRRLVATVSVVLMSLLAITVFCVTLVPYTDMHKETQQKLPQSFTRWHQQTNNLNIFNAYGLFRRMTGVGGRPEVVVEGSNNLKGDWQEFNFLYKPGDVSKSPSFVAPHQPRLDWQMWFAALGTYNYNPWFYHLAYRILTHQKEVLALMDKGPFENSPPKYLRAHLYNYHFTGSNDTTRSWWKREYKREYLPVLSLEDEHLMDYVKKTGLYVDPDSDRYDFSSKPIGQLFFQFLHFIAPARCGFEACLFFLVLGALLNYLSRNNPVAPAGKQKIVLADFNQKQVKQS